MVLHHLSCQCWTRIDCSTNLLISRVVSWITQLSSQNPERSMSQNFYISNSKRNRHIFVANYVSLCFYVLCFFIPCYNKTRHHTIPNFDPISYGGFRKNFLPSQLSWFSSFKVLHLFFKFDEVFLKIYY